MPPRLPLGAHRALSSPSVVRVQVRLQRRCASSSPTSPDIYDVVCVGGGPAGLSLLTGLRASPVTSGLKVALIEGQDLQKSRLQKDASLESFSNRCSSLTPASVRNLQGTINCFTLDATMLITLFAQKLEHGLTLTPPEFNPTRRCKYGTACPTHAYPLTGTQHARFSPHANPRSPPRLRT